MRYYSKIDDTVLLFSVIKMQDITEQRLDLSPVENSLQASAKILKKDIEFRAHKHLPLDRHTTRTEEAWVFLKGSVMATFYDIDDTVYDQIVLEAGDCAVVYNAGHSFTVLEDNTTLYEFKNGPYYGVEKDKVFLSEVK
jgi:mannose-6-phosphate isomerase-like protein (cupin superfamily)